MAKTSKNQKQVAISAHYIVHLMLEIKDIGRVYTYCKAYIHLGKGNYLPDLFSATKLLLSNYKKEDGLFLSHYEYNYQLKNLEEIFDKLC